MLRQRQAKNFIALLLLSHGVPMLLAGDEVLRSQRGNNNAWCQDNELSWFDWTLTEANQDMLRFTREMLAFRKRHACLKRRHFLKGIASEGRELPDVSGHGLELQQPLWHDPQAQLLAYSLAAADPDEEDLHIICNMSEHTHEVPLPPLPDRNWYLAIDTAALTPKDILPPDKQVVHKHQHYAVAWRSVVIFENRRE